MNRLKLVLQFTIYILLLVSLLSYAGQTSVDNKTHDVTTSVLPSEPAKEKAELYIINISGWTLIPSNQEITDNGLTVASLPRETYKKIYISSGAHEFRFSSFPKGPRVAKLEAESGKTYYLVVGYNPARSWAFPLAGDSMVIRLAAEEEVKDLIKKMKPAE